MLRNAERVTLAALALATIAACTVEVNINTNPDQQPENPIVTTSPLPPAAPRVAEAPVPPPPPPLPTPPQVDDEGFVRDALLRLREESGRASPPPPPEPTVADGPTFTPFTTAPSPLNRDEIIQALGAEYPPLLKDAGIGGTVRVFFFIEADGSVQDIRIDESSGHDALDRAALRVGSVYRFEPALNRGEPTPVWVSFPITFSIR